MTFHNSFVFLSLCVRRINQWQCILVDCHSFCTLNWAAVCVWVCVNSEDELVMWCVHCECGCAVQLMNNYKRICVEWRKNSFHVIHRNIVINRSDMHAERYWRFMQCHLNYVCSAKQASFTVCLIVVCGFCVCVCLCALFSMNSFSSSALWYAFGYFTSLKLPIYISCERWFGCSTIGSITALVEHFLYFFKLLVVK